MAVSSDMAAKRIRPGSENPRMERKMGARMAGTAAVTRRTPGSYTSLPTV